MKKRLFIMVLLGFTLTGAGTWAQEDASPTPGFDPSRQKSASPRRVVQPKFYPLKNDSKKTLVKKAKFYTLNGPTPTPSRGPGLIQNKASQPVTAWAPGKKKSYHTLYEDHR